MADVKPPGPDRVGGRLCAGPRRVLVVEDEPLIARLIVETVREHGAEVMLASDGRQAWDMARRNRPDLVLCDVLLPELDGFAFVEGLSASLGARTPPVIYITAATRWAFRGSSPRDLGAIGVITKPFVPEMLWDRILDLLQGA